MFIRHPWAAALIAGAAIYAQAAHADFRYLTTSVPNGTTNGEYFAKLFTANAAGPVTFTVKSGCGGNCQTLPTGILLNSQTGALYGKPSVVETKSVTITANDGVNSIDLFLDKFKVNAAGGGGNSGASFTTTALSDARINEPYLFQLQSEGVGPFIWGAQDLPVGITLDGETGVLSGTPITAGTFYVTLTNKDLGENNTVITTLPLTVLPFDAEADPDAEPPVAASYNFQFETYMLNNGEVGSSYADTYLTSGAKGEVSYSATGLPDGLTLDSATGMVSGTPAAGTAGTYYLTLTALDNGVTPAQAITVNLPLWIAPSATSNFYWNYFGIPAALYGTSYTSSFPITVDAKNGGTVSYSALGLPPGISYSASGVLSGTPTEVGVFPVIYTATSTTQGTLTLSREFVVLPPGGGDVGRLAVNLWVKKLSASVKDGEANDIWQAQYIYNADRRTGKIYNPYTQDLLLGLGAAEQVIAAPITHSEKTGAFSYKTAKGVTPAIQVNGAPASQSVKVKMTGDEIGTTLPASMLPNNLILGNKGYGLKVALDSKGKFLAANGYRNASFVVATASVKDAGVSKDSAQLAMYLADPSLLADFVYADDCPTDNKFCNRPELGIKLYDGVNVLLDKTLTDLVATQRTVEKTGFNRYKMKKVVKTDPSAENQLASFSFDNKTGLLKLALKNLALDQVLDNQQAHVGVEITIGSMSYFTSITLFESKPGSQQWSSKVSSATKPWPTGP